MVAGGCSLRGSQLLSGAAASAAGHDVPGRTEEGDPLRAIATLASVAGRAARLCDRHLLYEASARNCWPRSACRESFPKAACYLREYGAEIIMIKGATPIPFKLLTITAGFIAMPLLTFIGASLVSRSISFMIVGVLFRLFGAPIKAFIDKYLGLATAASWRWSSAASRYLNFLHMGEATLTFPQTIHLRYTRLEPPERRVRRRQKITRCGSARA
jgi:membrane protein YqaA with SNARE-associated domain